MNQKRAREARRKARTTHLTDDVNSAWSPLLGPLPVDDPSGNYDPTLDGDLYQNSIYTVFRRQVTEDFVHLSIRRNDRLAAHDWRDFQRIKSQLAGREWEAVELYPAESRLVDTSNQYHLWCVREKMDFGFDSGRCVTDDFGIARAKQRPLPPDWEKTHHTDVVRQAAKTAEVRKAAEGLVDFREGEAE